MDSISFTKTKNGFETCCINGFFLHSKYDPEKEGKNFAESIVSDFIPSLVFVMEPGIGYCLKYIKERFLNSKIVVVRYTNAFDKFNEDYEIIYASNDERQNCSTLLNAFGEEKICSALFVSYRASLQAFPQINEAFWNGIKQAVKDSTSILGTRSYFSKKWIFNSTKILLNGHNFFEIPKINKPIVITASGPSLKTVISSLKKNRKDFFLLAVSSSLSPLLNNNIKPDAVLSTDGGFWADFHLRKLLANNDIPLFLGIEGSVASKILKINPIIPLSIEGSFANLNGITPDNLLKIPSNGTVSGTALLLAKKLSNSDIFFAGLDLSSSKGFQHLEPNEIEKKNSCFDSRINTKEKRLSSSSFSSASLKIYENWFSNLNKDFVQNVYRLSENYKFNNSLGNIKDVNTDFFEKRLEEKTSSEGYLLKRIDFDKKTIKNKILNGISKADFYLEINPMKKVSILKSNDKNFRESEKNKLIKEAQTFIKKLSSKMENL